MDICRYNIYGWYIVIQDKQTLLTPSILKKILQKNLSIFFNDLGNYHWIFDFKIQNVWIEAKKIDYCKKCITLNLYN